MADYIVREAQPEDAEKMLAYIKQVADEPNNGLSLSSSAEIDMTVEEEAALIQSYLDDDKNLFLVAETSDGQIISSANCRVVGNRGYINTLSLGISVHKDWRNKGVGTAVMQRLIDHCRHHPTIHRLELQVFTDNARAIHVYEKLGFVRESIRRGAYYKEGRYLDMMMMAILFDDKPFQLSE